jgi:hypothetical protein
MGFDSDCFLAIHFAHTALRAALRLEASAYVLRSFRENSGDRRLPGLVILNGERGCLTRIPVFPLQRSIGLVFSVLRCAGRSMIGGIR